MSLEFDNLIQVLPTDSKVLDVGASGLEGENTTNALVARFPDYTGICIRPEKVEAYKYLHPDVNLIVGDFYARDIPDETYDLVVLDLNIENNLLKDWTDEGVKRIHKMLKPGGYLINYVMTTTEYGDPDATPQLIATHRDKFWGGWKKIGDKLSKLKGFEVYASAQEQGRPYIQWVMLKKTNGLSLSRAAKKIFST